MKTYEKTTHTFEPVFDTQSRILILGTFPSVKSRENQFYYGHPQNRFWKLLGLLADESVPISISEKKAFLLRNRIAIWDVIAECEIIGSSDSSIRNVRVNDMSVILDHSPVREIYANGAKAYELYMKYCYPTIGREITKLPSTSPANAAYQTDRLAECWKCVFSVLS